VSTHPLLADARRVHHLGIPIDQVESRYTFIPPARDRSLATQN
jgi:hypothetical protein